MKGYKVLLHEYYTKRDINGNCYEVVRVTNPKNGKRFYVRACVGNVRSILCRMFQENYVNVYETQYCTGTTKLSSLPEITKYVNECHPSQDWKKLLNSIGYRNIKV